MEATALSVGKSVLNGAISFARSVVAEEVALHLGVQRDHAFVTGELEMMQSFLMAAHVERDEHKVVKTWVKQVRDVAYDVEDSVQDFVVRHHTPSWWRLWHIPRVLLDRRHVAKQMKDLRAKVEDVSHRNVRYHLINASTSHPATTAEQSSTAAAAMFGINEARYDARQHQSRMDLTQLINSGGEDLRVIAVWGTSGSVGHTSIISEAYENPNAKEDFPCQAWVRLMRPFHPKEFVQSLVKQFDAAVGVGILLGGEKTVEELAQEFNVHVSENRYLIVITDVSSIEEWHQIKTCFPRNRKGNRIIVSTEQVEVASLCAGRETVVSELKQLSTDQTIYAFSTKLVGREKEKNEIIKLISEQASQKFDVMSVCGTDGVENTIFLKGVYRSQEIRTLFGKHAFIRILQPFKLEELLRSLAMQFYGIPHKVKEVTGSGSDREKIIASMTVEEMIEELGRISENNRYLIVVDDLLSTTEWDQIILTCHKMKTIGVIVTTTTQEDIAKYCCQKEENIYMLTGPKDDASDTIEEKIGSPDRTYSAKPVPISSTSSSKSTTAEILEQQPKHVYGKRMAEKSLARTKTVVGIQEEPQLVGRDKEISEITKLISEQADQQFEVVSVWGMGGLGKTTLVKNVYHSQKLDKFEKRAFATVLRPFNPEQLLRNLALQFSEKKGVMDFVGDNNRKIASMGIVELIKLLGILSEGKNCLIVFDDLSCTGEWDKIMQSFREYGAGTMGSDEGMQSFLERKHARWIIVITTRQEDVAKHCCKKRENICMLNGLEDRDAHSLFTEKVFKKTIDLDKDYPQLAGPAKLILKKCNGLPLAIVTIASYLADQPTKTAVEWRKLNDHISAELEMNPELEFIKTVLMKSYDGLPYYLKACFLYLSIFPEDHNISWRRLVHRWVAEGYSMEVWEKSMVEMAGNYFMQLTERSMVLPTKQSMFSRQRFDSCQLHDLIRDISIAKSREENLVLRLEEGSSSNTHRAVRHLAISSNWDGDEQEFESTVELSRIRSLTVFGKWRSFYISKKMRFLRVLDLENAQGLHNYHFEHIGKFLHLRYLSLRGSNEVMSLPDSLGNLRELETLDIKGTTIFMLPKTVIKLRKLRYLHAGRFQPTEEQTCFMKALFVSCAQCAACAPCCFTSPEAEVLHEMRRTFACPKASCKAFPWAGCMAFPFAMKSLDHSGVMLPRGIRKLKALHTLRFLHLAWENAVIKEIKYLTGLRKLGITGINKKNASGVCSAISSLHHLESLSISSKTELLPCLDDVSSPLENLQSLKLNGSLVKLPKLINGLQNLVKLKLHHTKLSGNGEAMQLIGDLPNLSILELVEQKAEIKEVKFPSGLFKSLTVLVFAYIKMKIISVNFEEGTMSKLEVLVINIYGTEPSFLGLKFLQNLKEVQLMYMIDPEKTMGIGEKEAMLEEEKVKDDMRTKLKEHTNRPILKLNGLVSQY
ncbi:unnamed protein product [Alopecurus aequalis]